MYSDQITFSSGYVSSKFYNRTDIEAHSSFCDYTNNMYPISSGAMTRRSGFAYFSETKFPSKKVELFDFIFNIEQVLVVEFGDGYIRFHRREGTVLSGGTPYEISSIYTEADVNDLDFAQINDTVYIAHPNYPLYKLIRYADDNWALQQVAFKEPPYNPINTTSTTLTASGSFPNYTITASSPIFNASRDVGRYIRIEVSSGANAGKWVYASITSVSSSTVVIINEKTSFGLSAVPTTLWRLGAFYTGNYPKHAGFNGNRLWLANTEERPATGWGSTLAEPENFAPSSLSQDGIDQIAADDSILFTIASNKSAAIQFLVDSNTLVIGTESGLFNAPLERLTPSNFNLQQSSATPLSDVSPIVVQDTIIAVSRLKNKVIGFRLEANENASKYTATDLSLYWEHLLNAKIKKLAYTEYPTSLIWLLTEENTLLSMLFIPSQNLIGVTPHFVTGYSIEDVTTIPNKTDGFDQLWIQGRIDNNAFIGYMEREYDASLLGDEAPVSARFLDLFLEYKGPPTINFNGLTHLSNKEVKVIADGKVETHVVNASGEITLDEPASNVAVGLPYTSELKTFDVVSNSQSVSTSSFIRQKQINMIKVGLYESIYCFVQVLFDRPSPQYVVDRIEPIPILADNRAKKVQTTRSETLGVSSQKVQEAKVRLWIEDPLPLTITGVYLDYTPTKI